MLTIAILSWASHKTLINTLFSYQMFGLDKLADQRIIFFQEQSTTDEEIARKYKYDYIGDKKNVGIPEAYRRLIDAAKGDLFLFLENDWVLLESAGKQITHGEQLLNTNVAQLIRYRHREYPGAPLWTRQFKGNELSRPEHLLDSIHWLDPDQFDSIKRIEVSDLDYGHSTWFLAPAARANWTNNPHMAETQWLADKIVPHLGHSDIERDIQHWWEHRSDIIVGQSDGLFTHNRIG